MPDDPEGLPAPKSSEDLLREARHSLGGGPATSARASEDLMAAARDWLATGQPTPESPAMEGGSAREYTESDLALIEAGTIAEPPPPRPTATARTSRRARPTRTVPSAPGTGGGDPARLRRRVFGLAATLGLAALAANLVPLFVGDGSGDEVVVVTTPTVVEQITTSEGSITSATDPCTGASISGDLEAFFTYASDGFWATLEVTVMGPYLQGSDGTTYSLEVHGRGEGPTGGGEFVFESDRMVMTREDGTSFLDSATFTVGVVDGGVDTWSYRTVGPECDG